MGGKNIAIKNVNVKFGKVSYGFMSGTNIGIMYLNVKPL